MEFSLRPAKLQDIAGMHRIRISVSENRLADPLKVQERDYERFVLEESAWLAEAEGRMLGFAAVDLKSQLLWALFVCPQAEGKGVGMALIREAEAQASGRGLAHLVLSTEAGSGAEQFYCRAGWSRVGDASDGEVRFRRDLAKP